MTKLLFIIDGNHYLFSETDLTPDRVTLSLKRRTYPLPFRAKVDQIIPVHGMLVVSLLSAASCVKLLTPQQKKVVQYLTEGMTVSQIAYALKISADTVTFHIENARNRLGVDTRNELIATYSRDAAIPEITRQEEVQAILEPSGTNIKH